MSKEMEKTTAAFKDSFEKSWRKSFFTRADQIKIIYGLSFIVALYMTNTLVFNALS